jgi:hypothetical protein
VTHYQILAAGPVIAPARTRPYRVVLLWWINKPEYSVHVLFTDKGDPEMSTVRWHDHLADAVRGWTTELLGLLVGAELGNIATTPL